MMSRRGQEEVTSWRPPIWDSNLGFGSFSSEACAPYRGTCRKTTESSSLGLLDNAVTFSHTVGG